MDDPYNLQRFVEAQDPVYARVCAELREGNKRSHWMWFVFPQVRGLGHSAMAQRYAISSREEAVAYLAHPILGARLRECTALVNAVDGRSANQIFGSIDELKFRSCLTLFASVSPEEQIFKDASRKYFNAEPDPATLSRL